MPAELLSLPRAPGERGRITGHRADRRMTRHILDARLVAAYTENVGHEPVTRHTSGLARAQWEYGLRGTAYWSKAARQGVLLLSEAR